MTYTAKKLQSEQVSSNVELFITKEVTTIDWTVVTIPESIGIFNLVELEDEKERLTNTIKELDLKIETIKSME